MIEYTVHFDNARESRLWSAAYAAESYIGEMSGASDEWPVYFGGRDQQTADKLTELMQELHEAICDYFPKKDV